MNPVLIVFTLNTSIPSCSIWLCNTCNCLSVGYFLVYTFLTMVSELLLKVELNIINQKTYQHSVILFQGEIVRWEHKDISRTYIAMNGFKLRTNLVVIAECWTHIIRSLHRDAYKLQFISQQNKNDLVKFDIVWLKLVLTWFHFRFLLHYVWCHNEVINFTLTWFQDAGESQI
jgi:hypothetical protein